MKTFSLFILTLLFSTFSISQEYKTLTSDGKLKKGRTILSGLITTIPEGTQVEIVYKSYEKGHYRVLYKNLNGYIHERHFKSSITPVTEKNLVKGHVIFREDFNNNKNNWTENQQASKAYYFKNGAYFITQRDNGRLTWEAKSVEIDTQSDFSIESSITLHEKNNGGAHLLFGMDETNRSYHSIKIKNEKGKKEVFIGKYVNGQWIGAWSDGFINEFGKPNLIQITKKGEEISFYVNGLFIERRRFEPFFGNAIALGCEGVQTSSFDYLSVQQGGLHVEAPTATPVAPKKVASFNTIAKVKLRSFNGVYTLPAMLNDALEVYATFEEGAADITISPNVAISLFKSGTIHANDWVKSPSIELPDGTLVNKTFKLKSLNIGGKTIYNVTCNISDYMEVAMILGKSTLNKFGNHKMDYKNETLSIGGN